MRRRASGRTWAPRSCALARQIGAELEVVSGLGRGTAVTLHLPQLAPAAAAG
jgi:hypothetical protein